MLLLFLFDCFHIAVLHVLCLCHMHVFCIPNFLVFAVFEVDWEKYASCHIAL